MEEERKLSIGGGGEDCGGKDWGRGGVIWNDVNKIEQKSQNHVDLIS